MARMGRAVAARSMRPSPLKSPVASEVLRSLTIKSTAAGECAVAITEENGEASFIEEGDVRIAVAVEIGSDNL